MSKILNFEGHENFVVEILRLHEIHLSSNHFFVSIRWATQYEQKS